MAFAEMFANAVGPAAKAYKANKVALKAALKGSWAAKKLAFKAFFRSFAMALRKKMAAKLKKRMQRVVRNDENEILQGGAELVIESYMAREIDDAAVKALAMEVAGALDPTGIMNVVQSFQAASCKSRAIVWMPAIGQRRLTGFSAGSNGSFPVGDVGSAVNDDIENDPISFEDGDMHEEVAAENINGSLPEYLPMGDVLITSESGDIYEEEDPDSVEDPASIGEESLIALEEIDNHDEEAEEEEEEAVEILSAEATASNETGSQRRLRGLYVV